MATKFLMTRDINGYNGFGVPFSDTNFQVVLTSMVHRTITVPLSPYPEYDDWIALFSFDPGSRVWVANNTVATVPAVGPFVLTASQLNPSGRFCEGGDVIDFVTDQALVVVGVSFYVVS